ncbi:GAF and ANTAR domain-containing protein [Allokutzneria oryzae]|uniref:GAF and ANTAR domain-containing protein n=1 Tax=Allokutzneria oryzae TaxID=1378989 RepID=UPI00367344FB
MEAVPGPLREKASWIDEDGHGLATAAVSAGGEARSVLEEQDQREELATSLRELTIVLSSTEDNEETLRHVADTLSRMVPQRPTVAVTLRRGGRTVTVPSSDAGEGLAEAIRRGEGRGPCQECLRRGEPVLVRDVASEPQWASYSARMLAQQVRSVYVYPLRANGNVVGALNMYSPVPNGFGAPTRRMVRLAAEYTGVLLGAAIQVAEQRRRVAHLQRALESRAVIDQAIGVIVAQRKCDADTAFEMLRAASQNTNRKLADIAVCIVASASGAGPRPGRFRE